MGCSDAKHGIEAVNKPFRVSDEDAALFRRAVGPVAPVSDDRARPSRRRPHAAPLRAPAARRGASEDAPRGDPRPEEESGEALAYARGGPQQRVLRRLRRGQLGIGAELDLHGLTADAAHDALGAFLAQCRERDVRTVRIVHGKGLGSPHGRAVIKRELDRWLRLRDEVLAFCSARPADGGTGAVYVLLRGR